MSEVMTEKLRSSPHIFKLEGGQILLVFEGPSQR